MSPAVAVVGTTASGKSALAHEVALALGDVEIAAVDSMTVYREMDIGTAKATRAQRAEVRYHLVDLIDPDEEFTVAAFQSAAREVVNDVAGRAKRLLYVGGTGLYGRAVFDNLTIPGQYPEVRAALEHEAELNLGALYDELVRRDPLAASRIEATNVRRVVRALEVTRGSGQPFSSFGRGLEDYPAPSVAQVGLRVDMAEIDRRIETRLSRWMDEGLLEEVIALSTRDKGLSRTARQAVGYRELLAHVETGLALEEAMAMALTATRRLARRQRSWFERDQRVQWFEDPGAARERIVDLLSLQSGDVGN